MRKILTILSAFLILLAFSFEPICKRAMAQIFPADVNTISVGNVLTVKSFTVPLNFAGTRDIATATGNVFIWTVGMFVDATATGLVSTSVVTNENTPTTLLGTTLLSALLGGKNLTPYQTPFILSDGKKIQAVNLGTGTGGQLTIYAVLFKGTGDLN